MASTGVCAIDRGSDSWCSDSRIRFRRSRWGLSALGSARAFQHKPAMPYSSDSARVAVCWVLAIFYVAAGTLHLMIPDTFVLITPQWVPFPRQVIIATGLCEVAGGIGLLTSRLRRAAGIALALYAVCVFPANIKHAMDSLSDGQGQLGWWYHAPRLALQPGLVWLALFAGGVVRWPFRQQRRR